MKRYLISGCSIIAFVIVLTLLNAFAPPPETTVTIRKSADFEITGNGSNDNWKKAEWITLPLHNPLSKITYASKAKALYSPTGLYFLYQCEDKKLTSTMKADFLDLWYEDVVEVFLQPDDKRPFYFEYEISPMNYELPIMIYNRDGKLNSWQPFHYEGDRKTRHATSVTGGEKKSQASVTSWTAEFFIPYKILEPFMDNLPKSGTQWRGNFYRIDRDEGSTLWSWQKTSGSFHDYKKFGTLIFE